MVEFSERELDGLKAAGHMLLEAEDRLPILATLSWERSAADTFFAAKEKELPRPVYNRIDPEPSLELVGRALGQIDGHSPVHDWLRRFAVTTRGTARMLASLETKNFYDISCDLYGAPTSQIGDGQLTSLDLAYRLDKLLSEFDEASLMHRPVEVMNADELKSRLDTMLPRYFGSSAPRVEVTSNVSAKAAAGRDYIKLRADAEFVDLDVVQLLQHEALVHIATGLNGQQQSNFPLLAESHAGNARTQEGLAVFAEFISGALDPRRFKRLANRTIAIEMAASGADFIEVYGFFRDRSHVDRPFEAFESARRVMRGGVIAGGAPFTKDAIYLGGLVEVHNYLRAAVRFGNSDYIRLLFVGKLDLQDLEAMKLLLNNGLITKPQFMPPWATDLRFLVSYLSYSTFLNDIKLENVESQFRHLFQ